MIEMTEEEDAEGRVKLEMENPLWLPLLGKAERRRRHILTTNLAAVVYVCGCVCVSVQHLTNFCPHALISNPNVAKILFA